GALKHVEGTGGAGAPVYHDILQAMRGTFTPSRGKVQGQLERFLAGGKPTNAVRGAIEIARLRRRGPGTIASPPLPPSAGEVPTRLERRASLVERTRRAGPDRTLEALGEWFTARAGHESAAKAGPPIADVPRADPETWTLTPPVARRPGVQLALFRS